MSMLLFRGAGGQQQSTRRRWGKRSREDGAGYAAVPLKQREDSVTQTAVPHKQRSREDSAGYAAVPPQTTGGKRRADGCSPQIEPMFGVDHQCY